MDAANTTFTSVLAHAKLGNVNVPPQVDYVIDAVSKAGLWTILGSLFALAVIYDQSELDTARATTNTTRTQADSPR